MENANARYGFLHFRTKDGAVTKSQKLWLRWEHSSEPFRRTSDSGGFLIKLLGGYATGVDQLPWERRRSLFSRILDRDWEKEPSQFALEVA